VILFVCTGNTCRSAMAEAIMRARLVEAGWDPRRSGVASAGVEVTSAGAPPSGGAVEAMADRGIDLSRHRTRPLDGELLADADLAVAMTRRHEATIVSLEPTARSRTFLAGEVVRLASSVGPRGKRPVADWVGALDAARAGHFTAGRVADEVVDPWGGTIEDYRRCADRLDGISTTMARLLTGA
jgi:protein-tyrosine phosphatase